MKLTPESMEMDLVAKSKAPPSYSTNRFNFHMEYTIQDIVQYEYSKDLPVHVYTLGPKHDISLTFYIYSGNNCEKPFKRGGWFLSADVYAKSESNFSIEPRRVCIYGNNGRLCHTYYISNETLDVLDDKVTKKMTLCGIVPVTTLKEYARNVLKSGVITIRLEGVVTSWTPYLEIIEDYEEEGKKDQGDWLRNEMNVYFHNSRITELSFSPSMTAHFMYEL